MPTGVGLTALALSALWAVGFIRDVLSLASGLLASTFSVELLLTFLARALAFLVIWHYWKGQNWARVAVLLWSLLVAARAVSFLVDHNLDPTALMSRPLSFFHVLLAIWMLYWLNTPPLRAWFKNLSSTAADLVSAHLIGKLCTALEFHSSDFHSQAPDFEASQSAAFWRLSFEHDASLVLHCPWRIVLDDNLAFASAPAELSYAPAASSAANLDSTPEDARRLLQNLRVTALRVAPRTSDLFLTFEMGIELQTWSADVPVAGGHAPAAGSAALPARAPAVGSAALPDAAAPQWEFSDPTLTVVADALGLNSQPGPVPAPPAESGASV